MLSYISWTLALLCIGFLSGSSKWPLYISIPIGIIAYFCAIFGKRGFSE